MTTTITQLKINGKEHNSEAIRVKLSNMTLNWEIQTAGNSVFQSDYEVRLGTQSFNLGDSTFQGNIFSQPFVRSRGRSMFIPQKFLARGVVYYGQMRVKSSDGEISEWFTFRIIVNALPFVQNQSISPQEPSEGNDLELSFSLAQSDANVNIRWFRNGVRYQQFDDYEKISREYVRYNDVWFAEILPYNSLEQGAASYTQSITVTKLPPSVSDLEILPRSPNNNDILEASYSITDQSTGSVLLDDKSKIVWYINDVAIDVANDSKFVRFDFKAGDVVRFSATPYDGISLGTTVTSDSVTIEDTGFTISNVRIDGSNRNLSVKSVNPTIEWDVLEPFGRSSQYAQIKVGTAPGADNIYSTVIKTFSEQFTLPDNTVSRGVDYFVSVSSSDSSDNFSNPSFGRFRIAGSLWEREVSNDDGWSLEVAVRVEGEGGYQRLSLSDGTRFAELRFSPTELILFLGGSNSKSVNLDLLSMKNILVIARHDDIRVFVDNKLIIDGMKEFIAPANDRFIEIGSSADSEIIGHFKRIVYTTERGFDPTIDASAYAMIEFEPLINFTNETITDIVEHEGDILVSVNSRNPDQSGAIYKIVETEQSELASTETVDVFDVNVNSISSSPDGKRTFIAHNKGASYFDNYFIDSFDLFTQFPRGRDPGKDFWELTSTSPFTANSFTSEGMIIDTTFANQARIDDRILTSSQDDVAAFSLSDAFDFITFLDYHIRITNDELIIYNSAVDSPASILFTESLVGRTIGDVTDSMRARTDFDDSFFGLLIRVETDSIVESQMASGLNNVDFQAISPSTVYRGSFFAIDPYNPNPYSTTAGGKWFYSHRKPGTPWFDKASNQKGWTVDFDIRIDAVEDSDRPSNTSGPEGAGIYINDGAYTENIHFLPQEILLAESNKSILIDTTSLNKYRVIGKDDKIQIWTKRESDREYELLSESLMRANSSNAGDAVRPRTFTDKTGAAYTVWHDTGSEGKNQIFFAEYSTVDGWSDPQLLVSESFDSSHPSISVDNLGNVYVVFETSRSDYTDIAVIQRVNGNWSEAYLVSSNLGNSIRPTVSSDDNNNIHVAWEDYRTGHSEIFYARRNAANGQWESGSFGQGDTQITQTAGGAKRPSIISRGLSVYIGYTVFDALSNSQVKMAYHPGVGKFTQDFSNGEGTSSTAWVSSGQGGTDFAVSTIFAQGDIGDVGNRADNLSIITDAAGNVIASWEDVEAGVFQIYGRSINSRLGWARPVQKITQGSRDSRFPELTLDLSSGFVYIAFEKSTQNVVDPYDPYDATFDDLSFGDLQYSIHIARYNTATRKWEGSGVSNGFDVEIIEPDDRISRRPSVGSFVYNNQMRILYQSGDVAVGQKETLSPDRLFYNIREALYDLTWETEYTIGDQPYIYDDVLISDTPSRKEIRFGDFSNNIGYRMLINQIRYYTGGEVEPFQIGLVSSATVDMPRAEVLSSAGNNYGDIWLGTTDGLMYFDRNRNETSVFQDSNHGISGLSINDIVFDTYSNMYLATNNGTFVSSDHSYFFKITGANVPSNCTSLDIDSKGRLFIGTSDSGFSIVDTSSIIPIIEVDSSNIGSDRTISSDAVVFNKTSGLPTNNITKIRIDANDVVWVGTTQGLVRYKDSNISVFSQDNGLASNKVNDIAIRDTARRYIATSAGISKMVGISVEKLDFGNINAPNASVGETPPGEIAIPKFNNTTSLRWQEPNHLIAGTMHDIYQITFVDEPFSTERPQITRFRSQDFTLVTISTVRNDDLQTFRLIGLEDREIPKNAIYEIILNGNKITRGFKFSPSFRLLRFDYPLLESDIVQINIRFDVEIVSRFEQNKAAKIAEGTRVTDVNRLVSANGSIYAMTGGDINTVQINDETTDLPFDRITLDTTPPQGKINIQGQLDRSTLRVLIEQLTSGDEYLPFDSVSGIDTFMVSNFTNFTTDGETAQSPIPFLTSLNHPIDSIFDDVTQQFEFTSGSGSRLLLFTPPSGSPTIYAATSNPGNIYAYNPITDNWDLRAILDDGGLDTTIEFIAQYQDKIFVGTGNPNGSGKIFISLDGTNFALSTVLPVSYAYCAEELNGILYIGAGSPEGILFSYNGTEYSTLFRNVSGSILDMVSFGGEIYAGTGSEGRTYRLDPINQTQQILNTDFDEKISSIGYANVNDVDFIFSGTSETAQIKRSKLPDGAFIHSFKTINNPVHSMENIQGVLWASIGRTLFALENVWNAKYTHSEDIKDIIAGDNDDVWFISDGSIFKVSEQTESRRIYLKLIDRAGNETNLFTDDLQTQLDPNLFDEITLEDLAGFTNTNRVLEVDEFGNTLNAIDGDSRFYSADKVDEEIGVYFSEIFNGTNGLVSWDRILWEAIIPENTSMNIFVRTADSRDLLLDAEFNVEIDASLSDFSDISFVNGQYLQFKIEMKSQTRSLSPSLRNVVVQSLASESTHFFTTNFVLPSRVKSGMLTSTKIVPVAADIIFGINTNNSVDFAEYQVVDENRIFTTDSGQVGDNLRVGIRLVTPSRGETLADDFGEYGPYNSALFFNSVEWSLTNSTGLDNLYHFRVSFFEDMAMENLVYQSYSATSQNGFSAESEKIQSTGVPLEAGETIGLSFVPTGDTSLTCNTFYWMKIESVNSQDEFEVILQDQTFIEACGTSFVDSIDFDYSNDGAATNDYHFRIRFYTDAERTELLSTAYSGNDTSGWFTDGVQQFPAEGVNLKANESSNVSYNADLSIFEPRTTYYLSIDAFNGSVFTNTSNSFTFRATDIDSSVYCGPYVDVPVVNNFAIAFELEGNQRIILKGS